MSEATDPHYQYDDPLPLAAFCSFLLHGSPLVLALVAGLLWQIVSPKSAHPLHPPDEIVMVSTAAQFEHQSAERIAMRLRSAGTKHPIGLSDASADTSSSSASGSATFSLQGKHAKLKHGEGIYRPLKTWVEDGLRYYQVAYEYVYPDGTHESGIVPWPVHFQRGTDPFAAGASSGRPMTPLPPPPADFMPPGTLGRALRAYFPQLKFEDEG